MLDAKRPLKLPCPSAMIINNIKEHKMLFMKPKILLTSILLLIFTMLVAVDIAPVSVQNDNKLDDNDVLAEFDGGKILRKDVLTKISKLPPAYQSRFMTVDGQIQILENIAIEEVFYKKALEMGLDKSEQVVIKLQDIDRRYHLQEYYKKNVSDMVIVSEEDLLSYYNDNLSQYYQAPTITIMYIQTETEEDALSAIAELKSGVPFGDVSDKYNQNTYARGLKGRIRHIRLNGNIPGIGNDYALEDYIRNSEVDEDKILGPFHTDYGWHIFKTIEWVDGWQKPFEDVRNEVEQRVRPQKERELTNNVRAALKVKYSAVVDSATVGMINLREREKNQFIFHQVIVNSPYEDIVSTVEDLLIYYDQLSPQEQIYYMKGSGPMGLLDQYLIQNLIYKDSVAKGYSQYFKDDEEYRMIKRSVILRRAYEVLVLDEMEITPEEIEQRYEQDKERYSNPAKRSIQVLFFQDKKTADKAWRQFKAAHKKKNEKKMEKLLKKFSTKPDKSIYKDIYDNGVITGLVQDKDFGRRIWDNQVGYLSPVFTAANGEIVFFRTLSEEPKTYKPKTEVEPRIYGDIKREKETSLQKSLTEELFVEYNLKQYPERIRLTLSAEQLFESAGKAERSQNYRDAIMFYDQIIKNYKDGSNDYKAAFMKAFVASEYMDDTELALRYYNEFLQNYPRGELHDSAEFMIRSLQGEEDLLDILD